MSEFNNRMDAQRAILNVINHDRNQVEELCGLSKKAIERWLQVNRIELNGEIPKILTKLSDKLFFLGNKSQEQVTDEYKFAASGVSSLTMQLKAIMDNKGALGSVQACGRARSRNSAGGMPAPEGWPATG